METHDERQRREQAHFKKKFKKSKKKVKLILQSEKNWKHKLLEQTR